MLLGFRIQRKLQRHDSSVDGKTCICLSPYTRVFAEGFISFRRDDENFEAYSQAQWIRFLLMTDNLRTNQSCFRMFRESFGSDDIYSCKHPVENDEFAILFLLYDPTHLKNIRNNWHTEKMQKLKITSPENAVSVIA